MKTYWPIGLGLEAEAPSGTQLYWTHVDRQGSVIAITDQNGAVKERMAYDSWGKRRDLSDSNTPDSIDGVTDNKGYTGHEMLDRLDLVHMNGRLYDPLVARFMSADPFVQAPEHSQSYNRYTYVWNNPTNLTDPTGFEAQEAAAGQQTQQTCDKRCQQLRDEEEKRRQDCAAMGGNCSFVSYEGNRSNSTDNSHKAAGAKSSANTNDGSAAPPGAGNGSETAASIKAKFDALPDELKQRFKDLGNQLITVPDSVADAFPSLTGKTAPGWGKITWDKIPGGYIDFPVEENGWKSPRALVVSLSGKYGNGSSDLFYHEFGHSIDPRGVLSSAPLFDVARRRDFYDRRDINPYFKGDPKEHFAEGFARYYSRDKSLKGDWPETYDYMKNLPKCLNSNGGCQ